MEFIQKLVQKKTFPFSPLSLSRPLLACVLPLSSLSSQNHPPLSVLACALWSSSKLCGQTFRLGSFPFCSKLASSYELYSPHFAFFFSSTMADEKKRGVTHGIEDLIPTIVKELIAGGVAGGIAKTAVAPLERVKILFQTRKAEFQSIGLFGSFRKIVQTEGLLGFYRGNGASVARIVPYAALHYMAYEQYCRRVILGYPDIGRGPVLDLVAGSFAGGTAVMCTYPLDLVRTKLAYQVVGSSRSKFRGLSHPEQVYEGILDCISKIYKRTGIRGLYRGVGPTLYGIFPYSGLKFYFYEEMKTHVPEVHKNDVTMKLACGSVAGLLGQTMTYPLDVVRRQMQVQALSTSEQDAGKGTLESLVMIIRNQGWRQVFSGLSINYMKVVPSVAIGFTVYDAMKSWLKVPSRDDNCHPSSD